VPLNEPPQDLTGFPARRDSAALHTLYRVTRRRPVPPPASPWWFSQVPGGRGRFDLPAPEGTCYWSSQPYGAFLEAFRGTRLVASPDVAMRRMWRASAPRLRLANLLARRAASFGITAAISSQPDYKLPRRWALALRAVGFAGLVGSCSHDPSSVALNVAVFGPGGRHRSRPGWSARSSDLESDAGLARELASFGIRIEPIPYDLPTVPPA
jgi:hypothetical protein